MAQGPISSSTLTPADLGGCGCWEANSGLLQGQGVLLNPLLLLFLIILWVVGVGEWAWHTCGDLAQVGGVFFSSCTIEGLRVKLKASGLTVIPGSGGFGVGDGL